MLTLGPHTAAAKARTIKRGVKETVKAIRKSPTTLPASSAMSDPSAVVIIAADISPSDVISHIPVLCEDHNIPYIYIPSRAELGANGNTKRSTSIVMITRDKMRKKEGKQKDGAEKKENTEPSKDEEERKQMYSDLVKIVSKAAITVRI
ncbi:MAG: hypothetical protein Q9198_011215 [Flavoplaca austrocitrina]